MPPLHCVCMYVLFCVELLAYYHYRLNGLGVFVDTRRAYGSTHQVLLLHGMYGERIQMYQAKLYSIRFAVVASLTCRAPVQ